MLAYIARRSLVTLGTLWVVSIIAFVIIQLPPGDYVTAYIAAQQVGGTIVTEDEAQTLRDLYGPNDTANAIRAVNHHRLLFWNPEGTEIVPHMAKE